MTPDDYQILERKTVCQSYFRIDRYMLRHRLFAGGWSQPVMREVFERGHSVAALLYDPKADVVVLIEQFRAGAMAAKMGPWLIECVAGIIEEGETPEEVARREAVEECGCVIGRIEPIGEFLYSTGACSEVCHLFVGEIDSSGAGGIHGLADEHEDIMTHVVPVAAVIEQLDTHKIDNAAMLIAIGWLARHHAALRQRWLTS
jgi:ADP-ribose pyrophosphatase